MNFRRLKHTLLRLSAQEKVIGLSTIIMIIGAFMPWYSVVMNFDENNQVQTALTGDLGVMGFVILLMSILSLIVMVSENLHLPIPKLGYKRESMLFFLLGQSVFLTLLMIGIYTKRSLEFTDAGLRFGSYMVLVGAFFGAFAAFSLIQKNKRQAVEEFFGVETEEEDEEKSHEGEEVLMVRSEEVILEESSESKDLEDEIDDLFEEDNIEQSTPKENAEEQSDFFTREAGIDDTEEDGQKPKQTQGGSMNFYEDN